MGRGWRPIVVGAVIVVAVFALGQAEVFAPSAASNVVAGAAERGEAVFERECAGCHEDAGTGGAGPALVETGLDASEVAAAVQQGRGIMPPGLVSGQEQADVVAYVVSISAPSQ